MGEDGEREDGKREGGERRKMEKKEVMEKGEKKQELGEGKESGRGRR